MGDPTDETSLEAALRLCENFDPDEGCQSMVLLKGHPYFKYAEPVFSKIYDNKWRVVWRDFEAVKQDCDFESREDAIAFLLNIKRQLKPPMRVSVSGDSLKECDSF